MLAAGEVMPTAEMYNALIRGRRGEGNGRHDSNASKPRSSRRRRSGYGGTSRKKSREAKTVVGRDELGRDMVQSGQGGFLGVRAGAFGQPCFSNTRA
jgi:hypothetical protein